MKKVLALLLAAIFVFALVSCGASDKLAGKTAKEAIDLSNEAMASAKAVKEDMTVNANIGGMPINISTSTSYLHSETDPAYTISIHIPSIFGSGETNVSLIWVNGIAYFQQNGEKMKMAMGYDEAMQVTKQIVTTGDLDIPSYFADAKIEKKDGKYVLTADKIPELLLSSDGLPFEWDADTLKINKMEAVLTPDGFLESATIDFSQTENGVTVSLAISLTREILPDDFTVSAPADADRYVDSGNRHVSEEK